MTRRSKYCVSIVLCLQVSTHAQTGFVERTNPFAKPGVNTTMRINGEASQASDTPDFLKLKAVMPSGQHALANINGQLLTIGESIDGFALVEVSANGVQLKRGEQVFQLPLNAATP